MPLLKVGALRPPPPVTGHVHPKCYMRSTGDCSTTISGEHYISATILREFGNLRTSGLPWFGPGETQVGLNALRSNILCTRHNSALSPLDVEGRRMLVAIRDGLDHIWKKSLSTKTLFRIVSGEAFELWGLKTLMGLLASKSVRGKHNRAVDGFSVPETVITEALTSGRLPPGYGLYVGDGSDMLHDTIGFAPLLHPGEQRVGGLRCSFLGIVMDFMLDPRAASAIVAGGDPHFRPTVLDLDGPKRTTRIILTRHDQRHEARQLRFNMAFVPAASKEGALLADRWKRKAFERQPR
ncbi:MAG: hypothetical protein C0494_05830 [Sphingobium sp.]|nr:hypothetical protein [Sphingobium sp.]